MGAYSELDAALREGYDDFAEDDPFMEDGGSCTPPECGDEAAPQGEPEPVSAASPQPQQPQAQPAGDEAEKAAKEQADEDAKRKAHEEAEAKRKVEWDARQAKKKAEEQKKLDELAAMSSDAVMAASLKRVGDDTEKLTRRSMKECVAEHIQTMCLSDPDFARKVMHPRKSMIHCIWYINRKAREFIEQEMKDNGFPKENGIYGSDVPDGLCYQWAADYFNDPNAKEDEEKEEKFVPKPYPGKASTSSKKPSKGKGKDKKEQKKAPSAAPPKKEDKDGAAEQMSLLGVA